MIVVCPSNIRRVRVDTHDVFAALAPIVSGGHLEIEDTYSRTIHDHRRVMPYLEQAFGERMRTEYVVVARRTADRPTIVSSIPPSVALPASRPQRRAAAGSST